MIIVASTVMAIGCANRGSADEPPLAEMSYVNMNQLPSGNGQLNNIPQQGLREIAIILKCTRCFGMAIGTYQCCFRKAVNLP